VIIFDVEKVVCGGEESVLYCYEEAGGKKQEIRRFIINEKAD
jgi:hypothetical protein